LFGFWGSALDGQTDVYIDTPLFDLVEQRCDDVREADGRRWNV
jgi:hypothetical protein